MGLVAYAKNEFKLAGWVDENGKYKDEMQEEMCKDLLEVIETVAKQGHSGFSIHYFKSILDRLLMYEPLGAIEDKEDQWVEYIDGEYQHRRRHSVFKDEEGTIYNSDGYAFTGIDGSTFTSGNSARIITLPKTADELKTVWLEDGETRPDMYRLRKYMNVKCVSSVGSSIISIFDINVKNNAPVGKIVARAIDRFKVEDLSFKDITEPIRMKVFEEDGIFDVRFEFEYKNTAETLKFIDAGSPAWNAIHQEGKSEYYDKLDPEKIQEKYKERAREITGVDCDSICVENSVEEI